MSVKFVNGLLHSRPLALAPDTVKPHLEAHNGHDPF